MCVRVIASRILHEICLLIGKLVIRGQINIKCSLGIKVTCNRAILLLDEHCCKLKLLLIEVSICILRLNLCIHTNEISYYLTT